MCSLPRHSSLNPPVRCRNWDAIQSGWPKTIWCVSCSKYSMPNGGRISQINSFWRNPNSRVCTIYSFNATKDRVGHLNKFEDSRLPEQILHSQLSEESRKIGKPKLRYKDIIKRNLGVRKIPLDNWQWLSKNRKNWRKTSARHNHWIRWNDKFSNL